MIEGIAGSIIFDLPAIPEAITSIRPTNIPSALDDWDDDFERQVGYRPPRLYVPKPVAPLNHDEVEQLRSAWHRLFVGPPTGSTGCR